jgi:outer membrane protein assembly factor BamB
MRASLLLPACIFFAVPAVAENWPAWRGPAGDGVTSETNLPLKWSATEGVKWKIDLPEPGNSTPVVWGGRIFLTQPVGTKRTLMCLDRKDGRTLWQAGPEWTDKEPTHKTNPFCSSSPVTDGERVIAWFGSAGLWCWSLDGKEQWNVDLGPQNHIWGWAASPVLYGDLCILNFGPGERSFVVAVNKRTGKEVWRFNVPEPVVKEGPGGQKGYTGSWNTGFIVKLGGREELLLGLPGALFSLDPKTGKELWHCNGLNALAYSDPLVGDGALVGFGGFSGYSIGVKPGGSGDITATHRLWQEKKNPQRIGSHAVVGKHGYFVGEPGVVQCVELATGKSIWQERMQTPNGRASTWSSLVRSGDRIYAVTQSSDVVIFKASPEKYEQLGVNSIGGGHTNSSLAVSDGQLFLRTHKGLWCIGK